MDRYIAKIEFKSNQMTYDLVIVSTNAKGQTVAILVAILVTGKTKFIFDLG